MTVLADKFSTLPQLQHIREDDAQAWVADIGKVDADRILWHLDRLGAGFGGSEIGALLLDHMGETPAFSSANTIRQSKLLRVLPEPQTPAMLNGIILEDAIAQALMNVYGGRVDTRAISAFDTPNKNDPVGLAGNPDLIWQRNHERVLVDIKVPFSGSADTETFTKNFGYLAQLNTYNILNDARGLPAIDRLINAHLEIPPAMSKAFVTALLKNKGNFDQVVHDMTNLIRYDTPGLRIHFVDQPINPMVDFQGAQKPLNTLITEIAALEWAHVLDGRLVDNAENTASTVLNDDEQSELEHAEKALFHLLAAQDAVDEKVAVAKARIQSLTKTVNATSNLSQTAFMNIKTVPVLDKESADDALTRFKIDRDRVAKNTKLSASDIDSIALFTAHEKAGHDVSPFLRPKPIDPAKFMDAITEVGENPNRFIHYKTTMLAKRDKVSITHKTTLKTHINDAITPLLAPVEDVEEVEEQSVQTIAIS